ncbi:MAG TPA: gamma-glutamylcyclotransferase family protein [Chitinophagaceae bacterium]|nr:gamma-glutamylcyclotransferase family protein [Chitinophagaceae bacterium]
MKIPETYQLFVYGSLRSGFRSHAYEYISRYFDLVGNAKVKGCLFDLGDYPAAKPTSENKFIIGELYCIRNQKEFSWAMGQLDDYEGVNVAYDEIPLYRRDVVDVHIDDRITKAWIYWYHGDVEGKPVIESGDVLQYLEQKK